MTTGTDTFTTTPDTDLGGAELLATRRTRSRRHSAMLARHVPSCRVRGMGY